MPRLQGPGVSKIKNTQNVKDESITIPHDIYVRKRDASSNCAEKISERIAEI